MYEEAARIRREEEKGNNEGFRVFYERNKHTFLIAAGIGSGGGALSGAVVGAAVGSVVAGLVGAGIGAGIGTVIGGGTGAGIGTGIALYRNSNQNNQTVKVINQNTETESIADNDGGRESPDSEHMSIDEEFPLISNIRQRPKGGRSQ